MSSNLIKNAADLLGAVGTPETAKASQDLRTYADNIDKSASKDSQALMDAMNISSQAAKAVKKDMEELAKQYGENTKATADLREQLALIKIEEDKLIENGQQLSQEKQRERRAIIANIDARRQELELAQKKMVQAKSNEKVLKSTNKFLSNQLGLGKGMEESFLGSMFAGDKAFTHIGAAAAEALKPQKLMGSALAQVQKATIAFNKELDKNIANLNLSTGGTGQYNDALVAISTQNRQFNVDQKKAMEAMTGLNDSMSMFNQMSEEAQMALGATAARLSALGVDGAQAGQTFDTLINGLGLTHGAAEEATMEMAGLSKELGIASKVIMKDFNSASSELAKYGKDMVGVFKAMQGAAEATGVKFEALMSITKQFDTFEGAATSAGKLNAILGGGVINSMDLLNATEEERVRLLIQSVEASGKSFESMNRFERQAVASAAGITDMSEANKIFRQSLSAYDEQVAKASAAKASQEDYNAMAENAISLGDKLVQIGKTFAVSFSPVIWVLSMVASLFLFLSDAASKFLGGIPMMVVSLGVMWLAFKKLKKMIKGVAKVMGEGLGEGIADVIEKTSGSVAEAIEGVASAVSRGAASLAPAITTISASMVTAAPGVTAFGIALSTVLWPLAATIAAVALFVGSIAALVISIILLIKTVASGKLMGVAADFYTFALGLGVGLAAITASVTMFISTMAFAAYMGVSILPILAYSLAGIAAVIMALAMALFLLPDKKLISLNVAAEGLAKVMEASVKLTPEAVKHTKQIVDSAADYVQIQAQMLAPDADAFVQALKSTFGGGKDKKTGQDVVLVLNDREFGRAVGAAINSTHNLNID